MPSAAFLASVRKSLFGGAMQQSAIDAIGALEAAWIDSQKQSLDQLAYVLATVFNECSSPMKPIEENLSYSAERAHQVWPNRFPTVAAAGPYAHNPEKLANHVYAGIIGNGNEASGDGWRFKGRGFSQLTGRSNYANFGQMLGLDLVGHPEMLLDPKIGAKVLVTGMIDGLFTGKKLSDYFTSSKQDATHARAIVNGDVAVNGAKIAGYWAKFRAALNAQDAVGAPVATAPVPAPSPAPSSAPASPPPAKPSESMKSWQQVLIDVAAKEGRPDPLPKFGADGFGGAETRDAIRAFQSSRNPPLPVTGQFDDATRAALNPPKPKPSISPAVAEFAAETLIGLALPPSPAKDMLMNFLPTIVQWVVALLPGIPDDLAKVNAELKELASTDSGVAKMRSAIAFGRAFLAEAERVVNEIDPQGAVVASTPIPAAVAAVAAPPK